MGTAAEGDAVYRKIKIAGHPVHPTLVAFPVACDDTEGAPHKTVILDAATGAPKFPNGSLGFRFAQAGLGKWNLDLGGTDRS